MCLTKMFYWFCGDKLKYKIEQVRGYLLETFCRGKETMLWMIASNSLRRLFLGICCNFVTCTGEQKLFVMEMREGRKGIC